MRQITQPRSLIQQKTVFRSVAFRSFGRIGKRREDVPGADRSPAQVMTDLQAKVREATFRGSSIADELAFDPQAEYAMAGTDGFDAMTRLDGKPDPKTVQLALAKTDSGAVAPAAEIYCGRLKVWEDDSRTTSRTQLCWLPPEKLVRRYLPQLPSDLKTLAQELDQLCAVNPQDPQDADAATGSGLAKSAGAFLDSATVWANRFLRATSKAISGPVMDQIERIRQELTGES